MNWGVEKTFATLLEWFFHTSGIGMVYFIRVTTNSNKYGWYHFKNGKFGGMNWINSTVQVILNFYVVMLQIFVDPWNLGWYTSYVKSILRVICGQGYMISIEVYVGCSTKIISISCFRHIRSTYRSEFAEPAVVDKCQQLRFMIQCINRSAARTFDLGANSDFLKGGIATRSCFCCSHKYNKYKPKAILIDFFVLANIRYYFFCLLDVYQGKD